MGSNDRLLIKNLLVRGVVGINTWEREHRQDILLNLEICVDTSDAADSDDIEDSLNYRSLTKAIIGLVEESSYHLVEALAHNIAALCVCEFGAERVRVRVEKPGALRFAESVGVEIERDASDFA
jgi:FolB domain-containing protein